MRIFILIAFLINCTALDSQLNYRNEKGKISVERLTTIHKGRQIIGYVCSVNIEHKKKSKKIVSVLDVNADVLFQVRLNQVDRHYLIETAFNGSNYALLFLDIDSKSLITHILNPSGKKINEVKRKLDINGIQYFLSHIRHSNNYTGYNQYLHEIGDDGFILMLNTVEKNLNTCQVIKINPDSTTKAAFYTFMTESPIYESSFLGQTKNQFYLSFEINGESKGQYFTETIGLNKNNLNSVYEIQQLKNQDYFFFPKIALKVENSDSVKLIGYYFDAERDMEKDFYDGFACWELGPRGDFVSERYISFQKDIYDLKFKKNNKGKDLGFLFMQNVIQDKNHNIYIVGEGYQKVADGTSMGASVMGMGVISDYTRLRTNNLALTKFDEKFNYSGTQIIDKTSNTIQLSHRYVGPIFEIGKLYNRYGLFDYLGSDVNENNIQVFFKNFRFESLSGGNYKIGRYQENYGGTIEYRNIEKLPNTTETYILPNVDGRVLFVEKIKKTIYFDFKN